MRQSVEPIVALGGWVIDGTYQRQDRRLVPEAADIVVWLDLPPSSGSRGSCGRTARRVSRKEELWSGQPRTLGESSSTRRLLIVFYRPSALPQTRRTLEPELAGSTSRGCVRPPRSTGSLGVCKGGRAGAPPRN